MTERHDTDDARIESPAPGDRRRYVAPVVTFFEPLEAFAAVCTGPGAKPDPVQCPTGPLNS
ncbi:MAG: hypothetical protein GY906_01675 [bacterium]|nr:hypothetical protein [bacterium]